MVTAQALCLSLALAGANETALFEFSAPWCGPCRTMEPIVQRLVADGHPIRQVNVDADPQLAASHRITGLPTFVMVANGREVDRVVGAASEARLRQMLERARGADTRQIRAQSPDPATPVDLTPPRVQATLAGIDGPVGQPDSQQHASSNPTESALQATVRLRIDDATGHSFGTGTIIDSHGAEVLVVTCGHIFRDSAGEGPITVETFIDGATQQAPGQLISHDLKRDIGLVSFTPKLPIAPVRVARSGAGIELGAAVFSIGCDRGDAPSIRHSRIAAVDKYVGPPNIEVEGQPVVGRSGGGLFSATGELIGICNFADPRDNEGIYASLATIHWELDRIGQRRIYESAKNVALASAHVPRALPSSSTAIPAATAQTPQVARGVGTVPDDDLEVICIVRSKSRRGEPGQVFVLEQPSADLLSRLTGNHHNREGLVPLQAGRQPRQPIVRAQSADP